MIMDTQTSNMFSTKTTLKVVSFWNKIFCLLYSLVLQPLGSDYSNVRTSECLNRNIKTEKKYKKGKNDEKKSKNMRKKMKKE